MGLGGFFPSWSRCLDSHCGATRCSSLSSPSRTIQKGLDAEPHWVAAPCLSFPLGRGSGGGPSRWGHTLGGGGGSAPCFVSICTGINLAAVCCLGPCLRDASLGSGGEGKGPRRTPPHPAAGLRWAVGGCRTSQLHPSSAGSSRCGGAVPGGCGGAAGGRAALPPPHSAPPPRCPLPACPAPPALYISSGTAEAAGQQQPPPPYSAPPPPQVSAAPPSPAAALHRGSCPNPPPPRSPPWVPPGHSLAVTLGRAFRHPPFGPPPLPPARPFCVGAEKRSVRPPPLRALSCGDGGAGGGCEHRCGCAGPGGGEGRGAVGSTGGHCRGAVLLRGVLSYRGAQGAVRPLGWSPHMGGGCGQSVRLELLVGCSSGEHPGVQHGVGCAGECCAARSVGTAPRWVRP